MDNGEALLAELINSPEMNTGTKECDQDKMSVSFKSLSLKKMEDQLRAINSRSPGHLVREPKNQNQKLGGYSRQEQEEII